jgi:phytoene dehydrogenase-like protein
MEVADDVTALLKRTPAELAYNKALERNIDFHKDLEFLITSIRKRRNEALKMLDYYRQSLGKRAEQIMAEILDAEFNLVPNQAGENQLPQVASSPPPPVPAQAENDGVADHCARAEDNRPETAATA